MNETRRQPLNLLARGAVEIIILADKLIIRDEHGLLLKVHSAKMILFDWQGEREIYGDLTPDNLH